MKITMRDAFLRLCSEADSETRAAIFDRLLELRKIVGDPHAHAGTGIRKLVPTKLFEVRVGLGLRAVFDLVGDEAVFLFMGTHDEVRRFVRHHLP